MKTIWKYKIALGFNELEIPKKGKILDVQIQGREFVCLWVLVNPEAPMEKRQFKIYGTGHNILEENLNYIGTFQLQGGLLVFHVFELMSQQKMDRFNLK